MVKMFRHGDLLLKEIREIPPDARLKGSNIIIEGEMTGHAHRLAGSGAQVFVEPGNRQYVDVIDLTPLIHEEHNTIEMPPGKYEAVRQREFDAYQPKQPTTRHVFD